VLHHARVDQDRDLRREPRREAEAQRVRDPEPRAVLSPQRLEVHGEADLPSPVHLVGLAVEGGELDLGGDLGVGDGDVELERELVAAEVVDVPAGALPAGALRVGGGDAEPVVVLGLVHRRVGDQRAVLLLEPLPPRLAVPRPRPRRQQRDLTHRTLRPLVPTLHRFGAAVRRRRS